MEMLYLAEQFSSDKALMGLCRRPRALTTWVPMPSASMHTKAVNVPTQAPCSKISTNYRYVTLKQLQNRALFYPLFKMLILIFQF